MRSGAAATRAVGRELEARQAAEGRDVLVLLADRLTQPVDLDVARLLRQLRRGPGARQWVCSAFSSAVVKLPDDPRPVPAGMSAMLVISSRLAESAGVERLPDDRMLDLGDPRDPSKSRILDDDVLHERRVDRDVDVLVDRRRRSRTRRSCR